MPKPSFLLPGALLALALFLPLPLGAQAGPGGGMGSGTTGGDLIVVATPPTSGRVVTVGGRIAPVRKISHTFTVAGVVDKILVNLGDRVTTDQALIRVLRDSVGETFRPVLIESRLSGVVSEIQVYEKEEVRVGLAAITILDDASFVLRTSLSDRDALAIRGMGSSAITGKTPDGTKFSGRILQVSAEPDYTTGLFTLTMEFPRQRGLSVGLVVFVDLAAEKPQGFAVKPTALYTLDEKTYLWMVGPDTKLVLRPVTASKITEGLVPVLSGLTTGERYVSRVSGKEKEGMSPRELIQANLGSTSSTGGK